MEYKEALLLYPTWTAVKNAAVCLQLLLRYDEALEMFKRLRDWPDLDKDIRAFALRSIERLDGLVGTLEIVDGLPGARVVIDGRERGTLPLSEPLRVTAGTHLARIYKDGYFPLERRVDVVGGAVKRLGAQLSPLTAFGQVRVVESTGRKLQVVIDNLVVGETPWQGMLDLGAHSVWLRGPGKLASTPTTTWVKRDRATTLTISAEDLPGWLRIEPTPVGAAILIDSVEVGHGVWEGRLSLGAHRIDVLAEGFPYQTRTAVLEGDARQVLTIRLERGDGPEEPENAEPAQPPSWTRNLGASATLGLGVSPRQPFPGHVGAVCQGLCAPSSLVGAVGMLDVSYAVGPTFHLGPAAGFLIAGGHTTQTGEGLLAPRGKPPFAGTIEDTFTLAGALLGAFFAVRHEGLLSIQSRIGAGVLVGTLTDERSASFIDSTNQPYPTGPVTHSPGLQYLYLSTEARGGVRITESLQIDVAFQAFLFGALQRPRWDTRRPIFAGSDGVGQYPAAPLLARQFVLLVPAVGASYRF